MPDFVKRFCKVEQDVGQPVFFLKGTWQYPGWLQSVAFHMSAFSRSHADCQIAYCVGQSGS